MMIEKIIAISIQNGAERIECFDEITQSGVFFQDEQLIETIENICSPLLDALRLISSEQITANSASDIASIAIESFLMDNKKSTSTAM